MKLETKKFPFWFWSPATCSLEPQDLQMVVDAPGNLTVTYLLNIPEATAADSMAQVHVLTAFFCLAEVSPFCS